MLIAAFCCWAPAAVAASSEESSLSPTNSWLNPGAAAFFFALLELELGSGTAVFLVPDAAKGVFDFEPGNGTGVFRGLLMVVL
jgi:hypothetical protein